MVTREKLAHEEILKLITKLWIFVFVFNVFNTCRNGALKLNIHLFKVWRKYA